MKIALAVLAALAVSACTPQTALLASAVPDGTLSTLLSQTQRVADANRRRIVAFEQKKDWEGLARFAEENLKRDAHTPDWWIVAGYAYTQQQRHARAAECYLEAVRLQPDVTLPWALLAESYRAAGEPQRAVAALDNALLARRDDPQLYWLLGETESDRQRWTAAVAAYRGAIAIDESYLPAWQGLKRAYEASGRGTEAREAQRAVDRLTSKSPQSRQPPSK